MTNILYQQIDQLSKEKGINPEIVVSAVEDAHEFETAVTIAMTRRHSGMVAQTSCHATPVGADTGDVLQGAGTDPTCFTV